MNRDFEKEYQLWCENVSEIDIVNDLNNMSGNTEIKKEAFYKDLDFGTAGLRGIMGAGTNKMNVYTVKQTTKALALYLSEQIKGEKSVAITYDSRINSERFAKAVVSVFASFGVKCYLTKTCSPTPFLSFLVRELGCDMGVNITSSHNPKEYNGYKVYNEQGCQINEETAGKISEIRDKIGFFDVSAIDFEKCLNLGLAEYVSDDLADKYILAVHNESLKGKIEQKIKMVYSALNGVGEPFITRILDKIGIKDVTYVAEQIEPNGNFTTCPYPNPERDDAFALCIEYAKKVDADIMLTTDPDSDRIGIVVKHGEKYVHLTGNEIGVLLCEYILRTLKEQGKLNFSPIVIRSIVSTPFVDEIVRSFGGQTIACLTGFKNICGEVARLEAEGKENTFVFAFEESCGYVKGTYVRDKDGIVACMLACELANELKESGKTLVDKLEEIKQTFGYYFDKTITYRYDGVSGEIERNIVLKNLRENPPASINGESVVHVIDFQNQNELPIPKANMIKFFLANGSEISIRPSGTEPLIKCYLTVKGENYEKIMQDLIDSLNIVFNVSK